MKKKGGVTVKQAWLGYGSRLKQIRALTRMNQIDFAASIGISQQTYSLHELGERKPSLQICVALHSHFGPSLVWLMVGEGDFTFSPVQAAPAGRRVKAGNGSRSLARQ